MAGQLTLLKVAVERDIDGLDMGVLEDGTPYLSARSLSKLTGAAISTILNQGERWRQGGRDNRLAQMLVERGIRAPKPLR